MITRSKKLAGTAAAFAIVAVSLSAASATHQDDKRSADSQYRHDTMAIVKNSAGNIGKILRGQVEAKDGQLAAHAEILAKAAASAKDAFEKDTRGADGFTEAKDGIWENWEDFAERMDKFAADTQALSDAVNTGDNGKIGPAVGAVFKNCKGCHDKYKES